MYNEQSCLMSAMTRKWFGTLLSSAWITSVFIPESERYGIVKFSRFSKIKYISLSYNVKKKFNKKMLPTTAIISIQAIDDKPLTHL